MSNNTGDKPAESLFFNSTFSWKILRVLHKKVTQWF